MAAQSQPDAFDLVILGAGSGGYATALRATQLGLRVALVEKDKVGGTCLHRGCIPTKAWLHAAEVADSAREAARVGVHATVDRIDPAEIRAYAGGVVDKLYRGLQGLLRRAPGLEIVTGAGRLEVADATTGTPAVRVGERVLTAPAVVLATGSRSLDLGLPVDGERVLTSDHALGLVALPESAIVLGGGVIGVEFASAWRSLGVAVTVVEARDRLLPTEEPELSEQLRQAFGRRGITVHTGAAMETAEATDGGVRLRLVDGSELSADILLVAVGRAPVSAGMGFTEAGVRLDGAHVHTDERLRTNLPGVYAVGDLVAGPQLAHRGFAHGIFVAEQIAADAGRLDRAPAPPNDADFPRITYSDPEVVSVGLTEAQARERFGETDSYIGSLAGNGRSQILQTTGSVKVVRRTDGPVVGIHLVGSRVGELAGEAQLITGWDAYPDEVAALVHAHPTQHEALGEAHLALAGRPLHTHG